MNIQFRSTEASDIKELEDFYRIAGISSEGVRENYQFYLLAENEAGKKFAAIGMEPLRQIALLRSFVFDRSFPIERIPAMLQQVLWLAQARGLESVFLATDKESSLFLFETLGFSRKEYDQLPSELFSSSSVTELIHKKSAVFMCKTFSL
ncbi:hypothetical protein CVD28_06675 [Bacillus sp. M6-12]|uniref:hypothetical protein n=1 Tax=Bacillus sp. M6-12 TaxID=2054166 RepID=UPI000C77CB0A|nr:hypothetical protein [Bacillus sp. M6-12]PLS18350.1 hypothetical protein CVD28_06675 [Bacillus sp. M6-12]